jgi:hypothetical protein
VASRSGRKLLPCPDFRAIHATQAASAAADKLEHLQNRQQGGVAWHRRGPDETTAMDQVAAEFKVPANRLMAIRR